MHEKEQDILKKIGARCKQLRKQQGYTSHESFAYAKGLNRSQYGKYEAGAVDMRMTSLVIVINALGVTVEEFFNEGFE